MKLGRFNLDLLRPHLLLPLNIDWLIDCLDYNHFLWFSKKAKVSSETRMLESVSQHESANVRRQNSHPNHHPSNHAKNRSLNNHNSFIEFDEVNLYVYLGKIANWVTIQRSMTADNGQLQMALTPSCSESLTQSLAVCGQNLRSAAWFTWLCAASSYRLLQASKTLEAGTNPRKNTLLGVKLLKAIPGKSWMTTRTSSSFFPF